MASRGTEQPQILQAEPALQPGCKEAQRTVVALLGTGSTTGGGGCGWGCGTGSRRARAGPGSGGSSIPGGGGRPGGGGGNGIILGKETSSTTRGSFP